MARQGLLEASGVVLARVRMGEGGLWLTLFLRGEGLLRASAPGAESGRVRFGGGTEPFVGGTFRLYRGRAGGLCLNGVDIVDGMIPLRRRPDALLTAVRWSRLVTRFLLSGHPADELLANLYWNMRLLSEPSVPAAAAGWRFLWRWLTDWGLASDMGHCIHCGRVLQKGAAWTGEGLVCPDCDPSAQRERPVFTGGELTLLSQVAGRSVEGVASAFRANPSLQAREGVFALASRCLESLLQNEK